MTQEELEYLEYYKQMEEEQRAYEEAMHERAYEEAMHEVMYFDHWWSLVLENEMITNY